MPAMVPQMPAPLARAVAEAAACTACAPDFARTATAHAPNPILRPSATARILVASQAPGARAHASGLPFDDPSGDRLRNWMGIGRDVFYDDRRIAILPMGFCFPGYDARGSDLPPPRRCAELWRRRLLAEMGKIELTLLIGGHAQRWHLGPSARAVTATVAGWREHVPATLPLPHPSWRNTAWLKRNAWFEAEVVPWLRAEVARLV